MLTVTTNEIWPMEARKILEKKGIKEENVKELFSNVLFPWNSEYNTNRVYYSLRIIERPLFIVKPITRNEIEKLLDYVKEKNLKIKIVNGKHASSFEKYDLMIDMSSFTDKKLLFADDDIKGNEILIAGAGNTQGALNAFLFHENSRCVYSHFGAFSHPRVETNAFPGGSTASVGCGGISSIGGIGSLCRTYSLTIDSVLSYTITLPPTKNEKSKTVIANASENKDLFWALRGGLGSNFGIISEITYKIIEVPNVVAYSVTWHWTCAEKILKKWKKYSLNRPHYFNEDLILYWNPYEKTQGIELGGIYVNIKNKGLEEIRKEIKKELSSLGGKLSINEDIEYNKLYNQFVKNRPYYNFSIIQPLFTDTIEEENVVDWIDLAKKKDLKGPVSIGFTLLGGKIKTFSSAETAYYPRQKKYFVDIASFWHEMNETRQMENWTQAVIKNLMNVEGTYVYIGFPLTFEYNVSNKVYFGKNYKRLKKVKSEYDPLNILSKF